MPQVLQIPAEHIAVLLRTKRCGPLEMELLHHIADAKRANGGRPLFVRLDFPEKQGGVEIRCRRGWLASMLWWFRREARIW